MRHRLAVSLLIVLTWASAMFHVSFSFVYTSSKKIEDMVLGEERILNDIQTAVTQLGDENVASLFSRFYQERLPKARERQHDVRLLGSLNHPNYLYHSIKQFAAEYEHIRSTLNDSRSPPLQKHLESIAANEDVIGARNSFIRLQNVYNLKTSDMINGNYFGFVGPKLSETDVLDIGEAAFNDNKWDNAISWLQEALRLSTPEQPTAGFWDIEASTTSRGRILALLGRAYMRQGDKLKAEEFYRKARSARVEEDSHILTLESELAVPPATPKTGRIDADFNRLCSLQNKLTLKTFDPRVSCSYRAAILPYYRFKEELVSVSPYVVLFYDFITDKEIDVIITVSRQKLFRGLIEVNGSSVVDEHRTSDLSFLFDDESPAVLGPLGKKVAAVTNLRTENFVPGGSYSAEPFQVVNYGMGGHYGLHVDFFRERGVKLGPDTDCSLYGGDRLATFLMYLTDVERGGSTVFNLVDLAVSPVKKTALFWYNYKPSGEEDMNTRHAGCPVVIGHKWVSNKWMWQYGNTFTRRCGLTPEATQLDIEPYMRKGWV
ncbi:hypothetical protein BsWGS_01102 [Bradybaena similaris]